MAGVQKICLNNLNINVKNALIVGIIIAKNSPRTIASKKKSGESRGVMSFTFRDSEIDTINADIWGSEYFVHTFYERFLVGDVVEISSPKICVKTGDNETFRPQVTSPFYLSLNEGMSDVSIFGGDTSSEYLPLLYIPTKPFTNCCGLSEVHKIKGEKNNEYVDLLVVVKSVKPSKTIKTKAGMDITVRAIEIMDNTTPASITLDIFDFDTIQRAEQFRPLESVLFVSDARVSLRGLQTCARTVLTHQPHTREADALRYHITNQANTPVIVPRRPPIEDISGIDITVSLESKTDLIVFLESINRHDCIFRGAETAAWSRWGTRTPATVRQVRDRLHAALPAAATLHALLTHLDLDELVPSTDNTLEELRVRFADHTGELTAVLPINVLEDTFGFSLAQIKIMDEEQRSGLRSNFLLEQCTVDIAISPPRVLLLTLRRAVPSDPIPLY